MTEFQDNLFSLTRGVQLHIAGCKCKQYHLEEKGLTENHPDFKSAIPPLMTVSS